MKYNEVTTCRSVDTEQINLALYGLLNAKSREQNM